MRMRAIYCTRFGQPEDLKYGDLPDVTAASGEVVVDVDAVGLNFFDLLLIQGKYQRTPSFPFSPGSEIAGVISAVGANVHGLGTGDRVIGSCPSGGTREQVILSARSVVKIPPSLDFEQAAGLNVTYSAAHYALVERAGAKAGETIAVLGAAGGIGIAAVQIAKLMGMRVIACASSEEKLAFAGAHGADERLNYSAGDLKEGLRALTGGQGVDIILDPIGDRYTEPALRGLGWMGVISLWGFPPVRFQRFRSIWRC